MVEGVLSGEDSACPAGKSKGTVLEVSSTSAVPAGGEGSAGRLPLAPENSRLRGSWRTGP